MKNVLFGLLAVSVSFGGYASDMTKDYQKMIKKYDVPKEARWLNQNSPADFWTVAVENNYQLAQFNKDINKGKGAENEALRAELRLPHFYPEYNQYVVTDTQAYCDSLINDMGLENNGVDFSFNIIKSTAPNIFSVLTEDGFAICVTEALYNDEKVTDDVMKGYVAQEYAHGILRHRLRNLYDRAKDKRKSRILNGVLLAVTATATCAVDVLIDYNFPVVYTVPLVNDNYIPPIVENSNNEAQKIIENLNDNLKNNTIIYSFDFTPGQVYEADMMAFRFLQNIGAENAYFDGLKILGARYDSQFETMPDHPTIAERLSFMTYVKDNPGYTRND
ncbi:MAG: hypothetical protein HDR88_03405 [Bacteroides sp.]|nr:hypothetical protein [Bacteroides sp.]